MKKLLVMAAILVAGIAANAASFKWAGANIYGADGTTKFSGDVTIYGYLSTKTVADAVSVTTVSVASGVLNATYNWTDATVGETYNFYMVFEDGGKKFDSSASTPTVIKSGVAYESQTATVAFSNMATATQAASSWVAVPEPTSGLLMLLGLSGLALKRKRT